MRNFSRRLYRLEAQVGVLREKEYMIVSYGHRSPEDCLKKGWPLFRCSEGRLHNVAFICGVRGRRIVNSLEVQSEEGQAVLKDMGYEEIRSVDDLPSEIEKMSSAELINLLMGRKPNRAVVVEHA